MLKEFSPLEVSAVTPSNFRPGIGQILAQQRSNALLPRVLFIFTSLLLGAGIGCAPTRNVADSASISGARPVAEAAATATAKPTDKHGNPIKPLQVPPADAKEIVAVCADTDSSGFWRVQKGGRAELMSEGGKPVRSFSADRLIEAVGCPDENGSLIALAGQGLITLHALSDGKVISQTALIKSRVSAMSIDSQVTQSLLVAGIDGVIYRYRYALTNIPALEENRVLERYFGHSGSVTDVRWHPFGFAFLSGDSNGGVALWRRSDADRFEGKYDKSVTDSEFWTSRKDRMSAQVKDATGVTHAVMAHDGKFSVIATEAGALELWPIRGFAQPSIVTAHKSIIYSVIITKDGRRVLSIGRDGLLRRFDVQLAPDELTGLPRYTLQEVDEGEPKSFHQLLQLRSGAIVGISLSGTIVEKIQ